MFRELFFVWNTSCNNLKNFYALRNNENTFFQLENHACWAKLDIIFCSFSLSTRDFVAFFRIDTKFFCRSFFELFEDIDFVIKAFQIFTRTVIWTIKYHSAEQSRDRLKCDKSNYLLGCQMRLDWMRRNLKSWLIVWLW